MTEPKGEGGPENIRVASYNVHRCIGRDGRHDPSRVARVLRELDADLVALQEVSVRSGNVGDVDQCDHLARATGMFAIRGPTQHSARGEIGNVLLSRVLPERLDRIDLSQPGREPRGAIDVGINVDATALRVLVVHLGLRRFERRAQVQRILDVVRDGGAACTVLAGDMNEWMPLRGAVRELDAWFGPTPAPRTFPAWRPLLALDRIWVRPRVALQEVLAHASRSAREASDHLPIRAQVRLR